MDVLVALIDEFWRWTGLHSEKWGKVDIASLSIDPVEFPKLGEICDCCIKLIDTQLTAEEIDLFLTGLAIDSEGEDILDACMEKASASFLYDIISAGVSHPQSEARWQLAELLRKDIPQREHYLRILLADSDAYVRKRAGNVAESTT